MDEEGEGQGVDETDITFSPAAFTMPCVTALELRKF